MNLQTSAQQDQQKIRAFTWKALGLLLVLLIIDQVIKIWVKTHMSLGESIEIFSWFKIHFTENPGMAYGIQLGSKLFLTLFRIAMMVVGLMVVLRSIRLTVTSKMFHPALPYLFVLIIGGGIGNIVDSVFYGKFFTESTYDTIAHFTTTEGYSTWGYGHVVDMFFCPIFTYRLPDWFPFWGGVERLFFSPVFNFADSCVSVGVIALLIFFPSQAVQALETSLSRKQSEKDNTPQEGDSL